jgi:hypothetical protein
MKDNNLGSEAGINVTDPCEFMELFSMIINI